MYELYEPQQSRYVHDVPGVNYQIDTRGLLFGYICRRSGDVISNEIYVVMHLATSVARRSHAFDTPNLV